MDKINWCLKQKRGIELEEPNKNLSQAYVLKAEEALEEIRNTKSNTWKATASYYAIYHALYAILKRIGIKCEIHSCTIEIIKNFFNNDFSDEDINLLEKSLQIRVNVQYYTHENAQNSDIHELITNAPRILAKCKSIIPKITEAKIKEIKNTLKSS